jgi:hypothetical protein
MATETRKILAQSAPSATVLTDVYTVPAATQTIISTLNVCNRGSTTTTFRISAAINGAVDTNAQYLYYDLSIGGNDSFAATAGITLGAGDVIRIFAGNANLTINLFGVEIT